MRCGISVPNLAEFADPRAFGDLAARTERAGWDGLFVWDHVVFTIPTFDLADPWLLLTVAALATERIQLGPMVTPVARRRPGTLARQSTTFDRLSGGRLTFGAGLGWTLDAEFGTWGEPTDPVVLAERLDESLEVLDGLWSGREVAFAGKHLTVTGTAFAPTPLQRPRPPVWIACEWPHRRPLRRAARWDGVVPLIIDPQTHVFTTAPHIVAEIVAVIHEHRQSTDPFDVVITGRTEAGEPAQALDTVGNLTDAGATWWLEGFRPQPGALAAAIERVEAGPPR
jgi:alkanesulfonate monooxygenase SsuD/methylene tetrahydromethanopterin reductase-like flavin-dependent oxidoreductase (luciferase family)